MAKGTCSEIMNQITTRKWQKFCKPPDGSILPLVHEFYDNAAERKDYKINARGKWVSFSKQVINDFYGLETLGEAEEYINF